MSGAEPRSNAPRSIASAMPVRLIVTAIVAVAMAALPHVGDRFGPPEAIIFRGTHLLFALTLVLPALSPRRRAAG